MIDSETPSIMFAVKMAVYKTFVYCLISEVEKLQLKMAYFTVFVYLATSLGTSKLLQEKLITNRGQSQP